MATLADQVADWIAAAVLDSGTRGAVVGLSGGVDSAVTAALCKRSLGEHVLGVILPCESDGRDEADARLLACELELMTVTARLDRSFGSLAEELRAQRGLARANLKPRLRMACLYYFANALSYLVAGTGNKTELIIGYFTKYGDGGADILPLGGLYKTQVWQLARELKLPSRIIEKPPSAGLWEGQTDEDELGITYERLDRILGAIDLEETTGVAPGILARVKNMITASAHKRACAQICEVRPPCVCATKKT